MTGLVLSSDTSRTPLPYATVYNKTLGIGNYTNSDGFFALVVRPGDTVVVSSIGFFENKVVVPEVVGDTWIHTFFMRARTYLLQEATVYPWGTRDQFRAAFVHMNIPDDDLERARKNLSAAEMNFLARNLSSDGKAISGSVLRQYQDKYYYIGHVPPTNIFNPVAWANFFNDLRKGNYKNPDK